MKSFIRSISAVLAVLMLISVFACEPAKPAEGTETDSKTESVRQTDAKTEKETEASVTVTEKATETERITEAPTEAPTEPPTTEPPTEPPTTEPPTEPPTTEAPTTEAPTDPPTTEKPTDPVTTEEPPIDYTTTNAKYFVFNKLSDGTYEISAKDVKKIPYTVVIPSEYQGLPVTQIALNSFAYCTNLRNLIIPESILVIRNYAFFHCTNLKHLELPESLNSMEYGVFGGCAKLASVTIPNGVNTIYPGVFKDCTGLKNIYFDEPSGWSADKTAVPKASLSNSATAANSLKKTYVEMTLKKQTTELFKNFKMKTINDGINSNVLVLYCETEEYATVTVTELATGKILVKEKALGPYFYGMVLLPDGQTKHVSVNVRAEGKPVSKSVIKLLKHTGDPGSGAFIGKDSHVYLNFYDAFYWGQVSVPADHMANVRVYLKSRLDTVRSLTGKNTKIIMVICTNPATIYHSIQYPREQGGRGDYFASTPSTQFADFMKNDEDIYVLDLREILSQHTDKLLFMQADSHWTQIASYYAYYLAIQKIKIDFPDLPIYDLDRDFNVTYNTFGGDLLNFMGLSGMGAHALNASVSPKRDDMKVGSNAPTAYVMGDSYYHAMSNYFDYMFSEVYLNEPATNPPLYDYRLNGLAEKKPDYLLYVWTERNIEGDLGLMLKMNEID